MPAIKIVLLIACAVQCVLAGKYRDGEFNINL